MIGNLIPQAVGVSAPTCRGGLRLPVSSLCANCGDAGPSFWHGGLYPSSPLREVWTDSGTSFPSVPKPTATAEGSLPAPPVLVAVRLRRDDSDAPILNSSA